MSFSADVKEELSKLNSFGKINYIYAEIYGYLLSANTKQDQKKIYFSTTNEYNINRFAKMLDKLKISYNIKIQGKNFIVDFYKERISINISNIETQEEKRALIRGAFMGGGLINTPTNKYHLEILFNSEYNKNIVKEYLKELEINAKEIIRNQNYSLYIIEGEVISNFLALIGANISVVRYEEIRVIKDKRNKINRIVNCETANLDKTIQASLKQIEAIKKIKKANKFENLPDTLKEVAALRLKNKECSLYELGKMLKKPIGKSGISHRLNRIIKIADEIN